MEAAARKMVQPSPLPQGRGWQLTPSWEEGSGCAVEVGAEEEVALELMSSPISYYNFGADLGQPAPPCAGGPREPSQRRRVPQKMEESGV